MPEPKWIKFVKIVPSRLTNGRLKKTSQWSVVNIASRNVIGAIRWFGKWRGYAFFPEPRTLFEKTCLRDIANFCEEQTKKHMKARRAERTAGSISLRTIVRPIDPGD